MRLSPRDRVLPIHLSFIIITSFLTFVKGEFHAQPEAH
jgi:hypothetical protein